MEKYFDKDDVRFFKITFATAVIVGLAVYIML